MALLLLCWNRCWVVPEETKQSLSQIFMVTSSRRSAAIASLFSMGLTSSWEPARAAETAGADLNLLGQPLQPCTQAADLSTTGWTRTGACAWEPTDAGFHQVCATISDQFLKSSANYDGNDLSRVVNNGGHWCICAWAWASAVSRDSTNFEGLQLDCNRTNGRLRSVYRSFIDAGRDLISPSGASYPATAALKAIDDLCGT
eukprot:TRINITY_DN84393_c0_g1_i1.p1 TRINITY_DN84393_c0_g1~~TRINITY_DN84393_c0_g1_i1.p1  ORF type:complete len:223 (+),score=28.22 TRINITY_DN84393_c0_g1_i1:68-670(+)